MMELRVIFVAIEGLLSTSGGPEASGFDGEGLEKKLNWNLASYNVLLEESRFGELKKKLDLHKTTLRFSSHSHTLENPTLALYRRFTVEAVSLVTVLEDHMSSLNEQDQQAAAALAASGVQLQGLPQAPKALLSVSELQNLHNLLEFAVSLGVYPFLRSGIDAHLALRLSHAASITKASNLPQDITSALLYDCCAVIVKCFGNEVIGAAILQRHLSDVLAALVQVCYCKGRSISQQAGKAAIQQHQRKPITSPAEIVVRDTVSEEISVREMCMVMLLALLRDTHQPLVIKELLVLRGMPLAGGGKTLQGMPLAGGGVKGVAKSVPKWLRDASGKLLSERLMSEKGVHHVISGILEDTSGEMIMVQLRRCNYNGGSVNVP